MRPSPEVVKAKRAEIARRYRRKFRHSSRSQFAAIRVAELNRLFTARYGEFLPDDERGREALEIVAHHLIQLAGHPQERFANWAGDHCPWLTIVEGRRLLAQIAVTPRSWKADSLAWRLKLTYADRQTLKITTIGAIDCSQKQRFALRNKAKALREKARRKALRDGALKAVSTIILAYMLGTAWGWRIGLPAAPPVKR